METLGSKGSSYTVKPLSKALRVLVCLGEQDHGMSLVEISHRTGLPKTTVFKYLYTFREGGFVSHDLKTQTYRLGMRLWELGRSVEKGDNGSNHRCPGPPVGAAMMHRL